MNKTVNASLKVAIHVLPKELAFHFTRHSISARLSSPSISFKICESLRKPVLSQFVKSGTGKRLGKVVGDPL